MDESRHDAKLAYMAPEIESLGTVAEITAAGAGGESFDGSGYTGSHGGPGGGTHGS